MSVYEKNEKTAHLVYWFAGAERLRRFSRDALPEGILRKILKHEKI